MKNISQITKGLILGLALVVGIGGAGRYHSASAAEYVGASATSYINTYCTGKTVEQSNTVNSTDPNTTSLEVDNYEITWAGGSTTNSTAIAFYELLRYNLIWVNGQETTVYDHHAVVTHDSINNPEFYTYNVILDRPQTHYYRVRAYDTNCKYSDTTNSSTTIYEGMRGFFKDGGMWNTSYGVDTDKYYPGDFNGDGKSDMMIATTRVNNNGTYSWYFMRGTGTSFADGGVWNSSYGVDSDSYYVSDLNGDNKDDILISTTRVNNNNSLSWYLMKSNGSTFTDGGQINSSYGLAVDKYYVSDFNGDNKDDMLISTTRIHNTSVLSWYLMRSTGAMFVDGGQINNSFGLAEDTYNVADFTNDGMKDMIITTTRGSEDNTLSWFLMKSNGTTFLDGGDITNNWNVEAPEMMYVSNFEGKNKFDSLVFLYRNEDNTYSWHVFGPVIVPNNNIFITSYGYGGWRKSYGAVGDKVYVGNFAGDAGSDIIISRDMGASLRWWGMYSAH